MKRKAPSLQKSLPRYYFLVIFVIFTAMLTAFYIYYTRNLRASEYLNLQNVCDSAYSNMEQEIEKMSTVSLNTIYSKDILPGIRKIPVDQLGTQQTYTQVQAIYNSISAMIGPQQTVAQINLYHKNGFSAGILSGITGSIIILAADCLARSAGGSEIPISILTSLLGVPMMIWLLMVTIHR